MIEAEWDYLYVEVAGEDEPFRRIMPMDKGTVDDTHSVIPSGKGHEGAGSLPGFTGRSGDLDGDGKVEIAAGCDPTTERTLAEDRVGSTAADPCESAQWIGAGFDLSEYRGREVTIRFTYFTDMAAVEGGALLDNIAIPAIGFREDFEGPDLAGWQTRGFTLSSGQHHLAVPHFYLLEYRDPYREFASVKNYDQALSHPGFLFFPDRDGDMSALNVNYRPGVVMWYYNGEFLWSQNEHADTGPGRGFLLVVDSNPQEFEIPALPQQYYQTANDWTHWQFDEAAQPLLRDGFVDTMGFQRRPDLLLGGCGRGGYGALFRGSGRRHAPHGAAALGRPHSDVWLHHRSLLQYPARREVSCGHRVRSEGTPLLRLGLTKQARPVIRSDNVSISTTDSRSYQAVVRSRSSAGHARLAAL